MEKEISETYYFDPTVFNENGKSNHNGISFRMLIKEFERDFHGRHATEYALNLYGNSQTMNLLARSSGAAPFLIYGMELTQGNRLMQRRTLMSTMKWILIAEISMCMALILHI